MSVDASVVGSSARTAAAPSIPLQHHARLRRIAAEAGHLFGATFDGFAVGFAATYIAVVGVSGLAAYLGFGAVLDVIATFSLTAAAIAMVAGILSAVVLGARRLRLAIDRRLEAGGVGVRPRIVIGLPLRIVGAIPVPSIPLVLATVAVAYVSTTAGPARLLAPNGMLAPLVYLGAVVGASIGFAAGVLGREPRRHVAGRRSLNAGLLRRAGAGGALVVAVLLVAGTMAVGLYAGPTDHLIAPVAAFDGVSTAGQADLADPGASGALPVRTLSYGSGTDRHRPEYGASADLITGPVDATRWLPALEGGNDEARAWYWGFDRDTLPLDGLVWYPDGIGPFPLVLIVHGNHAMGEPSEPGYAYLGEHLASRGYVVASIDEDFLNGSWAGDWGGREQLVRAWLIRLHIDRLRAWSADPTTALAGLVDESRIAVIGHSRGGEAASIAASWNGRDEPPLDLTPWPDGITIKAVVSIAPSDGQYTNDASLDLDGVDFLTLAGGHDADAVAWSGIRQYDRTTVAPGGFKAALWAYRANHGQFNSVWGPDDQGPFSGVVLDRAALLSGADQERIAKVAIGAFLEASLRGVDGYRGLFRRPMVGRSWLPDDVYLVASDDGSTRDLVEPASGVEPTMAGLAIEAVGGTRGSVVELPLRALQGSQDRRAIEVTWTKATAADPDTETWRLTGISTLGPSMRPVSATALRLELANATSVDEAAGRGLDPEVELTTTDGVTVRLPLSRWGQLPPPLPTQLLKSPLLEMLPGIGVHLADPVERVLQTYDLPLREFEAADPAFHADRLEAIALRFDRAAGPGALYVARVGFVDR